MEDLLDLWGDMILNWFFSHHFDNGVFKFGADSGDPSFNAWVEFAKGASKGLEVGFQADEVGDETIYDCHLLVFTPGVNIVRSLMDGFVTHGVLYGVGFQGIGKHNGSDVCRGRREVKGFDTSDTQSPEGVVQGVLLEGFAEVTN